MQIEGFTLENEAKIKRAVEGSLARGGMLKGGLQDMVKAGKLANPVNAPKEKAKEAQEAWDKALLAEYDRLGGLITKDSIKVKNGSFWDIVKRQPREVPEVIFVEMVDGEILEMEEAEAKMVKEIKKKKESLKKKKSKKAKK